MKKIVVACGTGMATSTIISEKLRAFLDQTDIRYTITQCILSEISSHSKNASLIVTSMKIDEEFEAPVVLGIPFLIGINEEQARNKVLEILSK